MKQQILNIDIPQIVKEYVLKNCGRMPETQQEVDQYLDLINHGKKYAESFVMQGLIGKRYMKKLGFQTPEEIKKEGKVIFNTNS
jgi:hypothetical protein